MPTATDLNVFPVNVRRGGELIAKAARVMVAEGRVYVFEQRGRQWALVAEHEVESLERATNRVTPTTITTPDGELQLMRAGGCGCSNPLKRSFRLQDLLEGAVSA